MNTTANPVHIRALRPDDYAQWAQLFGQYADFYNSPMSEAILATTWSWLLDANHPLQALVAESPEQRLLGLAHCRACPDSLLGQDIGFLDDLFVVPECRGQGIARRLIVALAAYGQTQQWPVLRWVTADDNRQAQRLYDSLAQRTRWLTYDLDVAQCLAQQVRAQ